MSAVAAGALVGLAVVVLGTTPASASRLAARPPASRLPVPGPDQPGPRRPTSSRRQLRDWTRRLALRVRDRVGRYRRRRQRQDEVIEVCSTFSAELRAGRPARQAMRTAARGLLARPGDPGAVVGAVDRLARPDTPEADVPALLLAAAAAEGWEGLADLSAGWVVASDTGSPVSAVVDRIGEGLRARQQLDREVAVELAGPRATARLLMALPALGLALGRGVGADPLQVLLRTPFGRSALAGGCVLMLLGWLWTTVLARRAGRP